MSDDLTWHAATWLETPGDKPPFNTLAVTAQPVYSQSGILVSATLTVTDYTLVKEGVSQILTFQPIPGAPPQQLVKDTPENATVKGTVSLRSLQAEPDNVVVMLDGVTFGMPENRRMVEGGILSIPVRGAATPPASAPGDIPPSDTDTAEQLAAGGQFTALTDLGDALANRLASGDTSAVPAFRHVVALLDTVDFGRHAAQELHRHRLALKGLAQVGILSSEDEAALLAHLTRTHLDIEEHRHVQTLWQRAAANLAGAIDPDFDPRDLPELSGPAEAADSYRAQILLRRLHRRFARQWGRQQLRQGPLQVSVAPIPAETPLSARLVPEDDFEGRNITRFGIGERIDLSLLGAERLASGIKARLRWRRIEGSGLLSDNIDGEAHYQAGPVGETALLRLLDTRSGASLAEVHVLTVAPTDGYITQRGGTAVWHVHDSFSVGFIGNIFVSPDNVSYAGVQFREGTCPATASGWLAGQGTQVHPIGSAFTITGTQVNCQDTIRSGSLKPPPDYAAGDFTWPIPWQYQVPPMVGWTNFTIATHHHWSEATGKANIQKANSGTFSKIPSDPDSGL